VPRLVAIAALLACAADSLALDPQRASSQYVLAKWGPTLPSATIHALLQSRDRRIWLGTTAGLVRFDGSEFTLLNAVNTAGLDEGGVSCLAEGRDGALYLGTTAGTVLRYRGGSAARLGTPAGSAYVNSLLVGRDGALWIGLPGHDTIRWVDERAVAPRALRGIQGPLALAEDGASGLWIGTRADGLLHYDGDRVERYAPAGETIQALRADRNGVLWMGTPHGLLRRRGDTLDRFTTKDGLTSDDVTALLDDRDGNLWVGTSGGGLNRLASGRWTRLTTAEGLSDDDVRCLLEDHEGNVWAGTGDGLSCVSDGRFVTYGRLEGLREPAVSAIAPASNGGVWLGFASGAVARLHEGRIEYFPLPAGVGREAALSLHEMRDGSLWIAQDNARVFHLKDGVVTDHTPVGVEDEWKVRTISEDDKGPVFWVTVLGPARIEGHRVVPLAPRTPTPRYLRYSHAVYRHADGTLWVCDLFGLARLRNGVWTLFKTKDGLPHNRVRSASLEPDGSVWAATAGGLAYVKGDKIQSVTIREGLPENYLRLVLDDGQGFLWLASMGRIFRLDKREIFDLFAGRVARVHPLLFDTSDGLRTTEGLLSNGPGFRGPDGRLWFATTKGVSVIDPRRLSTDEPAPRVTIERIAVDGASSPPAVRADATYPPGRGEVTIDYVALRYRAVGKVHFRHRLEGLDRDWVEAGTSRRAYYSSLPPGRYRFSVTASNRDGVYNAAADSVELTIGPPFYQRPLFFAACVAGMLAVGAAAHRVRLNQVRGRLAAVIQERTRIARELHDTLAQGLAGVKLHIDTALTTMAEKPELARRSIQCARSIATSSLAEVRRSIWVLRAQAAKGEDGLVSSLEGSLKQLTADSDVLSIVEVTGRPRGLPVEVERNMLRIAHEAVTNALRHSQAKTLAVELRFADEELQLRVRDDGCGFEPEKYLNGPRGEHFGLLGIRERAQSMGGEVSVWSRPAEGTEVACRLPYDCVDPMESADAPPGARPI
jgi:signal transduction histidine kinase/ligand-binding sensor domain-containing protein